MNVALTSCMGIGETINVNLLIDQAKKFEVQGKIDPLENLNGAKVYLFSGTHDTVVKSEVVRKALTMYERLGVKVTTEFNVPAEHCYPTVNYGHKCEYKGDPYINKCD